MHTFVNHQMKLEIRRNNSLSDASRCQTFCGNELAVPARGGRFQLSKLRQLLLRNDLKALCSTLQRHDLTRREFPKFPRRHIEAERTVAYPTDLFHMVADL